MDYKGIIMTMVKSIFSNRISEKLNQKQNVFKAFWLFCDLTFMKNVRSKIDQDTYPFKLDDCPWLIKLCAYQIWWCRWGDFLCWAEFRFWAMPLVQKVKLAAGLSWCCWSPQLWLKIQSKPDWSPESTPRSSKVCNRSELKKMRPPTKNNFASF